VQYLLAIVVLGSFLCLVLMVIGLAHPSAVGMSSRRNVLKVYLGIEFVCLVLIVTLVPSSIQRTYDLLIEGCAQVRSPKLSPEPEYRDIASILDEFRLLTNLQQKQWNEDNEWKIWVQGRGIVTNVKETGLLSEIPEMAYEVTVEVLNNDRVILFYNTTHKQFVLGLNRGTVLEFRGRLRRVRDWGFWRSAYVRVE